MTRALIETILAADLTQPDALRHTGDALLRACGWRQASSPNGHLWEFEFAPGRVIQVAAELRPNPLADLREAVQLIPPGHSWAFKCEAGDEGPYHKVSIQLQNGAALKGAWVQAGHASAELAICIAALRARMVS